MKQTKESLKLKRDIYRASHRQIRREQAIRYHDKIKREVLSYYSNSTEPYCLFCGEKNIDCLSLDHINDDGYLETERGSNFYQKVRRTNFPEGFETLCMNCQYKKRAAWYRNNRKKD
jgi:5-methylcytosine-specific restriction endonuclease McrA